MIEKSEENMLPLGIVHTSLRAVLNTALLDALQPGNYGMVVGADKMLFTGWGSAQVFVQSWRGDPDTTSPVPGTSLPSSLAASPYSSLSSMKSSALSYSDSSDVWESGPEAASAAVSLRCATSCRAPPLPAGWRGCSIVAPAQAFCDH